MNAPLPERPRRPLSLWRVWAVILFLLAIAFAVSWALVQGSIRRAEERRRAGATALPSSDRISASKN